MGHLLGFASRWRHLSLGTSCSFYSALDIPLRLVDKTQVVWDIPHWVWAGNHEGTLKDSKKVGGTWWCPCEVSCLHPALSMLLQRGWLHTGGTDRLGFSRNRPSTGQRWWLKRNIAVVLLWPFCIFSWLHFTCTAQLAEKKENIKEMLVYWKYRF